MSQEDFKVAMDCFSKIDGQNVIEVYGSMAAIYQKANEKAGFFNPEIAIQEFLKLNLPKSAKILDFACGSGKNGRLLAEQGYHQVYGVDGSDLMLQEADKKKLYKSLTRSLLGVGQFPTELHGKFDVVIATGAFSKNHVSPLGTDDIILSLKSKGFAIFSIRDEYIEQLGYKEVFDKYQHSEEAWKFVSSQPFENYPNNGGHTFLYPSKNRIYVYQKS